MRLRAGLLAAAAFGAVFGHAPTAIAKPFGNGDSSTGNVSVRASTDPVVRVGGRSLCTWTWLSVGQLIGIANQSTTLTFEEMQANAVVDVEGVEHRVYSVICPGLWDLRLIDPTARPNFEDAITDFAEDTIELPVPNVNPSAAGGGYVNLGMWLAVEEASYDPITASAGPTAWMTVTPTPGETFFDFGNGARETCAEFGEPIIDLDTVAEGPCGYTYEEAGTFTLTATTTWLLPYESSFGPGALPPMTRTTTFDYTVREIQTVGVGG